MLGQVVPVAHEAAEAATEVKDKAIVCPLSTWIATC